MERQVVAHLPTKYGDFDIMAYSDTENDYYPHFALVHREMDSKSIVAVRIHSECLTGDLLGSMRCDCGDQLAKSLEIAHSRKGIIIYLRQEGRGIGLINKLRAYNHQDTGMNTIDANLHLGLESDGRTYEIAVSILNDLGISSIDLITNNPEKIKAIESSNITLRARIPIIIEPNDGNRSYLNTKEKLMGHMLH